MEIRKFLVEIKPDGRVYATEYLDSESTNDLCDVKKMLRELMRRWGQIVSDLRIDSTITGDRAFANGIQFACNDLEEIYHKI